MGSDIDLAAQLRQSSVRAFIDLILGDRTSIDLNWYFFLMGKMKQITPIDPQRILQSLRLIEQRTDREIILVDTVVSGRAATNITTAFKDLRIPIESILAVNNLGGSKLQARYKNEIQRNLTTANEVDGIIRTAEFVEMPLVSEDKGASLLGLAAVNFANFNTLNVFAKRTKRFSERLLPQSCLWILPPLEFNEQYKIAFSNFLRRCRRQELTADWQDILKMIDHFMNQRGPVPIKEIQSLVSCKEGVEAFETASHIISVTLTSREEQEWITNFNSRLRT